MSSILNFYDFEVFKEDWLVVIINPYEKSEVVIINDKEKLQEYYDAHKNQIWVGYNNNHYDQYILKAILCGFNPKEVNDFIIKEDKKGWQFSSLFKKFQMYNFDVMQRNDGGLKSLEGFMGSNIKETSIPFDIDRKLTESEIEETIKYCRHDVEQTIEVFLQRKDDLDVQLELIKEFNLPLSFVTKTQTQLTAEILEAKSVRFGDDFNINFPEYLNKIKKYKYIVDWFKKFKTDKILSDDQKKEIYGQNLETEVAGVPHVFAWGGLHGALPKYFGKGYFLHIDVSQYYPSLMTGHNYFSRAASDEGKRRYEMMRKESIRLKAFPELKKKRTGYKTCNNKAYGAMKDKYNKLFDPLNANNICVTGQLALLLLIEMLEPHCKLIQSNTDGLIVKLYSIDDYELIDDICWEWEQLTHVKLAFDPIITRIYQKDVNNYLFVNEDGEIESKGAYVKSLSPLDFDLPIVNKAIVDYLIYDIPIEKTINECDALIMFQKIVKLSGKFKHVVHNGKIFTEKCFRVFASTCDCDSYIGKQKEGNNTIEKFANTPEHCFIVNDDVKKATVGWRLDKEWYISMAKSRLKQFGVII